MAFPAISASAQSGPSGFQANVLSITKPACNVGDRMVVFVVGRNFAGTVMSFDLPGFALRQVGFVNPSLPFLAMHAYDRVIDGTEGTTFTLTSTNAAYLYAYAFTVPAAGFVGSDTTGSGGAFDSAHQIQRPNPPLAADALVIAALFGWSDPLTAGPSGWTLLFGPTDGLGYAWSRELASMPSNVVVTPLDSDRWIQVTVAYELVAVPSSGTIAATDANDTSSMSGSVQITGTIARTDATDVMAATGNVPVVGTVATTDTNDAFNGVVVDVVGNLTIVDAPDNCWISVARYGGAPTVRREDGPVFLNRRRRRYFNPSRNPVTGP